MASSTIKSQQREALDVLIVGAGPTGLTLAAQLRAFGVSARIIDRQADRVHESRALAVQPRTLEVIQGLGISKTLGDEGNEAVHVHIHFGERVVPIPLFDIGIEDTAYPFLLFISQAETEAILNEHLNTNDVRVERSVELVAFDADKENVACTLRHASGRVEHVHARYLVGCDGAHSTVRRGAGIPFEGDAYPQTFVLADLEVDGPLSQKTAHVFVGAQGMLFFFPLGQPATWRMQAMRPESGDEPDGEQDSAAPSLDDRQALADAYTGGMLRLRDPVWSTYFRLHHRHASRYRVGRVFLAGDAAHIHSPARAQGMNTGMQDASNLGWKLAWVIRGVADEALLNSYEAERRPVGRFVLRFSDQAFAIAVSDHPLVRFIRLHVAPWLLALVRRSTTLRTIGFRMVSQLGIRYRNSPAVVEDESWLWRGLKAGDRLPNAALLRDGRPTSLHQAVAGPCLHLLLCGVLDAWDAQTLAALRARYRALLTVHHLTREARPGALVDVHGKAFARLGVNGAAYFLVRPDGHVALHHKGTDLEPLARYMAQWFREVV